MEKIDLANELGNLQSVSAEDMVLGFSKSGKKFGFIP